MALEQELESEIGNEDTRGLESKRERSNYSSESSQKTREEENYLGGMIEVTQTEEISKDPHVVGKVVGGKLGDIWRTLSWDNNKKWDGYH